LFGRFFTTVLVFSSSPLILMAQDAPAAPGAAGSPLIGILLMLAVFFFLIILPQSRKAKKQAAFLASLEKGDAVVTNSGIYGKIHGLADKVVTLEIAPNVRIRLDRQSIMGKDTILGEGN
jgi:preprotein translocase subunit YajC